MVSSPVKRFWQRGFALVALSLSTQIASAQTPEPRASSLPLAGSRISNQAQATYDFAGFTQRLLSNSVEMTVAPVEDVELSSNLVRRAAQGAFVALPHRLRNTGNVVTSYAVSSTNASGDQFNIEPLRVVRDLNGNGLAEGGEPTLNPTDFIRLEPGAFVDLLILGTVPTGANSGDAARVTLEARTQSGQANALNTDTISVENAVSIEVRKGATPQNATRGALVTWNLVATLRGAAAPRPIAVSVDGAARELVILRDEIPAQTSFESAPQTDNVLAQTLFHRAGDALHTYTTSPQTPVDAVAWGWTNPQSSATLRTQFVTRVAGNASGDLFNTAHLYCRDGETELVLDTPSNAVEVVVPLAPPALSYYTDDSFSRITKVTGLNRPLFLQGDAASCNQSATLAERVQITLRSTLTGDTLAVSALETGPNTGIFRVENPIPTSDSAANSSDGTLQTRRDDTLNARLGGCGTVDATTQILVDPLGVVFDSRTNLPLAGIRVSLVDAISGAPATVFDFDGVTRRPSTVITGADGVFQFPQVAPGNYRLVVEAPGIYTSPSKIPAANLPANRNIDPSGSYGGAFEVRFDSGIVEIDIPLDSPAPTGVFLEKAALSRDAEIGGTVDYSLTLRNVSGAALNDASITDTLPLGFSYVKGSSRVASALFVDPQITGVRRLVWTLGNVPIDGSITLRYRVRIGAGAQTGRAINRAQATASTPFDNFTSNVATAEIRLQSGVFTARGIVFGRVFVDENRNGVVDETELGVPGARVFLEDGTFAISDRDGKWSIYGAEPLTHVVKIDRTTLPLDARLLPIDTRYASSGATAFADLKNGEMQKVNFALVDASAAIVDEVKARITAAQPNTPDEGRLSTNLSPTIANPTLNNRALPATGTIGNAPGAQPNAGGLISPDAAPLNPTDVIPANNGVASVPTVPIRKGNRQIVEAPAQSNVLPRGATDSPVGVPNQRVGNTAPSPLDSRPRRTATQGPIDGNFGPVASSTIPAGAQSLEEALANLNGDLTILNLKNGDVLASPSLNIRIAGAFGADLKLSVNGSVVDEKRIGTRSNDETRGVQGLEFIGVKLRAGANTLRATQTDSFGNARGQVEISVVAPGDLGRVELQIPKAGVGADGRSSTNIGVRLVDEKGVAVTARTPLTLETTAGLWQVEDLNLTEPGVQVFLEGGRGQFALIAPSQPTKARVRVSAGLIEEIGEISFVPFLRPVLAAGLVETQIGFGVSGGSKLPTGAFERELEGFASGKVGARGAGYIKGRIQGKYLLSMRFDTQNREDERLFRDIQPDEFYPVYGDSSTKGFDAQSTGKLYVRVDRDNSYVLYGDFSTATGSQESNGLSRYGRAFTGGQTHIENERLSATAFYARDNTLRVVRELRGNGTSGPYELGSRDIREQSERVEIIVRDRNNPGVVLRTTPQTRFSDYTLDGFTFGLLFRAPIPSFDPDGNPVFIRVTFEADGDGPNFSVAGLSGQLKLTNRLQLGASVVRDDNPENSMSMSGLNAALRLSRNTVLLGEYARTRTDELGSGNARRFELRHDSSRLQARLFSGRAGANFNNPEAVLTRGRAESGVRATLKIASQTALNAEAIQTRELGGNQIRGGQIGIEHALGDDLRIGAGVRHSQIKGEGVDETLGGDRDFTSAFARLNARVPGVPQANVFLRGEKDLSGSSKSLALGGDYQISSRARLYATHEFFDAPLSLYELSDTQRRYGTRFGIESDYARGASLFSEYRIAGGIDGRSSQAAIGLRNNWTIGRGLRLNTALERTKNLSSIASGTGERGDDGGAISVGLESLASETLKWTARAERRNGNGSDSTLLNAGAAYQPSRSFTLLGRGVYARSSGSSANSSRTQLRLQLGGAYRPVRSDRFNALAKYEFRGGDDPDTLASRLNRRVHLVSGDANYQFSRSLRANLHTAFKKASDESDGLETGTSAYLVSGRVSRDLGSRFNVSLLGASMGSRGGARQTSLGVEAAYLLNRDLMFSLGYNFAELRDDDFDQDLNRGFYLRLKWKFDEDLFRDFKAFQKAPVASEAKAFVPIESGAILSGSGSFVDEEIGGTSGTYRAPRLGGGE